MTNPECVKNIDLLGNNFHTVNNKYCPKSNDSNTTFNENPIWEDKLKSKNLKDKHYSLCQKRHS